MQLVDDLLDIRNFIADNREMWASHALYHAGDNGAEYMCAMGFIARYYSPELDLRKTSTSDVCEYGTCALAYSQLSHDAKKKFSDLESAIGYDIDIVWVNDNIGYAGILEVFDTTIRRLKDADGTN
jgi:hypothetical protein